MWARTSATRESAIWYRDVLSGLFARWFADHTAEEITDDTCDTSVLFERYRSFAAVAEDERVTANRCSPG